MEVKVRIEAACTMWQNGISLSLLGPLWVSQLHRRSTQIIWTQSHSQLHIVKILHLIVCPLQRREMVIMMETGHSDKPFLFFAFLYSFSKTLWVLAEADFCDVAICINIQLLWLEDHKKFRLPIVNLLTERRIHMKHLIFPILFI